MSAIQADVRSQQGRTRRWTTTVREQWVIALLVGALACLLLSSVGARWIAPYALAEFDLEAIYEEPSREHLLGTDELGRDLLSRVLYGGRLTFAIALAATAIAMAGGALWGFVAALRGGWIDELMMRLADVAMAVPIILFALILVAAFGTSGSALAIIIGLLLLPATARMCRSALRQELTKDYYLSAIAVGASKTRIVLEELLPNTTPILLAQAALNMAAAIFTEASLSFIGLGVQPPGASWGTILQQGYQNIHQSLWYPIFPGAVIILAIWLLNGLSDRLQSLLDPRTRR